MHLASERSRAAHDVRRLLAVPALGLVLAVAPGCTYQYPIRLGPPVISDEPVRADQTEIPRTWEARVEGDDEGGTEYTINVFPKTCDLEERRVVSRTTTRERVNPAKAGDWAWAVIGIGAVGAGVGVTVDAQTKVAPNDMHSRTYNPIGPTAATAIGVGAIVAGAAVLLIPIVDGARVAGSEETTVEETLPGEVVGKGKPCKQRSSFGKALSVRAWGQMYPLGKTEPDGSLKVDLDEALPKDAAGPPEHGVLSVNGDEVGTIDLAGLAHIRDQRAWTAAGSAACSAPTKSTSCDGVKGYLRVLPNGKFARVARERLAAAETKLKEFAEAEAWASADAKGCRDSNAKDPDDIRAACVALSNYVKYFPEGGHVADANAILKKQRARAVQLMAEADRKKAAEEAAAQAKERREAAAAQAQERREAAAAQAEQRREADAERRRCAGNCRMGCSQARRFDECLRGCVESQCQ
jgi:hypothetical protein